MASNPNQLPSEEELVSLLRAQDKRAVAILYDKYSAALFGVIVRIVKEEELAEDVLQEVFLRIWTSFDSYDSAKGRLFTWMLNITKNLSIDKIRSRNYRVGSKMIGIDKGSARHLASQGGFRPEHVGLKEVVAQLSEEQRQIIDLMYFNGFTQAEIAEEYNIPLGTVKTRARSAIKQLSKLFKEVD